MGLNQGGRGRGHGMKTNFGEKSGRGGMINQGPMLRFGSPSMPFPPVGFPPKPFNSPPVFGGSPRYNFGRPLHVSNKFNGKTFKNKFSRKSYKTPAPEIDLTKPWVTEEIINEDKIKQELLETWKNDKTDENWVKYKAQKQTAQKIYEKAKSHYAASHPNEVVRWESIPVSKHYFCETCDKSFRTDDDLFVHVAEHETCGREGCDFSAHPKIIAKHIKMQHETGLYKRIGKLYTDEDIAKWIEERKKRYPTKKVVEEKKILEQEKLNRGEKMKETKSIFNKSFNNKTKGRGRKKFEKKVYKNIKNRRTKKKMKVSLVQMSLEEETSAVRKGVPAFSGIKCSGEAVESEKKDFDISDEEWKSEIKPPSPENPLINSALGLLATCYNSDEESRTKETRNEPKVEDLSADDGSDPEEVSSKIPLLEENSKEQKFFRQKNVSEKKDSRGKKRKNSLEDNNFQKRSLTLLEKLLKNEIRHERNVILQCVHYVVKNNFFKM